MHGKPVPNICIQQKMIRTLLLLSLLLCGYRHTRATYWVFNSLFYHAGWRWPAPATEPTPDAVHGTSNCLVVLGQAARESASSSLR